MTKCSECGGAIAVHAAVRGDAGRIVYVTDGESQVQYPGDAGQAGAERGRGGSVLRAELRSRETTSISICPTCDSTRWPTWRSTGWWRSRCPSSPRAWCTRRRPDVNPDHRALFDSVAVGTSPPPGQVIQRVLTYAPTSSTEWTPAPLNWFPELVRRYHREVRAQARRLRALRDRATRVPPHPRSERAIRAGRGVPRRRTAAAEHAGSRLSSFGT